MILTGNHQAQQGQVLIAASQNDNQQQSIKFISNNSGQNLASPTKTITLSQAHQMGLLGSSKVQHILPSSSQKQVI